MRRLTAYVAGSVTLATGVITYAALERPNFYSAAVYLSQSNACLMILCNMALVLAGSIIYALQQLLFGPLRPLETEQLWERGWFAMMEWVFAMSTFRDEFGVWFLSMFLSLFTGKVWGWIAEGRVEQLEQQAPNDTRLFHGRLVASLAVYVLFAVQMFKYAVDIVLVEARPGMTIMFVFEFAILCISAWTTCLRYVIWVQEQRTIRAQINMAVEARKAEIRKQRKEAEEKLQANPEAEDAPNLDDLPKEDDVDENEIEAPGWESKRGWVFALDIISDLLKLVAYMAFFTILTVFYGIPIYIIRDLYMTMRSFTKRVTDYLRFQAATRDMDTRYPNATAQDLAADSTCIVCREEMRPADTAAPEGAFGHAMHQKQKPKKLPCGHILHFGCLSSWLERQQACPICRRSVFTPGQAPANAAGVGPPGQAPAGLAAAAPNGHGQIPQNRVQQRNDGRVFRLGPLRIQFGGQIARPNDQEILNALGRLAINHRQNLQRNRDNLANLGNPTPVATAPAQHQADGVGATDPITSSVTDPASSDIHPGIRSAAARIALNTIETQIQREILALNLQGQRAQTIRNLLNELDRSRGIPQPPPRQPQNRPAVTPGSLVAPILGTAQYLRPDVLNQAQQAFPVARAMDNMATVNPPQGIVIPQGWTLVPLSSISESNPAAQAGPQMLQTLLQQNTNSTSSNRASVNYQSSLPNPLVHLVAGFTGSGSLPNAVPHINAQSPFPAPPDPNPGNGNINDTLILNGISNGDHATQPATNIPSPSSSSTAPPPTAPNATWSFPNTRSSSTESAPTQTNAGEVDKGKAPALSISDSPQVPETHVEPPTPITSHSHMHATVEDAEGEDSG
ncbi:uncharacterized protein PV09_08522 [Verruconis gallopava]|uniref:RING-type E3 ubiquitin transferase n=1 Tax=Verruconis gallopava TaxID=253628 RepID=A0A0D2A0L3_9PEZI|nr:uncharacterized protein PV09_08522 [Verruconis gallopava]KIV99854.1 hypothetical protein PV09_08522 [Verruconis gallopava]